MTEEDAYSQVAAELEARDLKPGLWAKAIADSVGNENVAKSLYIKFRANQLMAEERSALSQAAKSEIQKKLGTAKQITIESTKRAFLGIGFIVCATMMILCAVLTLTAIMMKNILVGVFFLFFLVATAWATKLILKDLRNRTK